MRGPFEPIGKCAVVVLSFLYSVRYRWGEAPAEFTAPLHFPAVLSTTCTSHVASRNGQTWRFGISSEGTHVFGIPRGAVGNRAAAGGQGGLINSGLRAVQGLRLKGIVHAWSKES